MAGVFDWLDNLTTQVGTVAGRAVEVAGAVAQTTAATQAANTQNDQTAARPVASAQVSWSGGTAWIYVGVGLAVIVAAVVLLRKR